MYPNAKAKIEKFQMLIKQPDTLQESIVKCISKELQGVPESPQEMFCYTLSTNRILRGVSKSHNCRIGEVPMSLVPEKQDTRKYHAPLSSENFKENTVKLSGSSVGLTIRAYLGIHGLAEGRGYTVSNGRNTTNFHLSVPKEKRYEMQGMRFDRDQGSIKS